MHFKLEKTYVKLSPPLTFQYIKSPEFKKDEVHARYSIQTCIKFLADYCKEKIAKKENYEEELKLLWSLLIKNHPNLAPDPLSIDLISSPEFKADEVKARYSEDTRRIFIEDYIKEKIAKKKEKITKSDLNLSGEEHTIFIKKLQLTNKDYNNFFLKVLNQFPKKMISENLKAYFASFRCGKKRIRRRKKISGNKKTYRRLTIKTKS
ncbi:hypothetical protein RHABOEDO_001011 [Candidatus Rhabdochlamydia oedothoracis]|uniref:Uncharacterized protein n=1 Tax=Candidatus Rhabdochlamydia oedothoracis TaxID=2720720 RepID=A0ABX8V0P4_9BACT|nr:hypothetical protein RHOW815_000196 [Candidatus Rhabdochlamydia sp. W815]QYF48795.1 hypothetical protein RHABOEDO_001011 [Candidatus Rhabdochlamydia oedothoracis]